MIDSSNYTGTLSETPCCGCKRRDCTMSVSYGNRCPFAIYYDYTVASGYCDYSEPQRVKRQKGKKTYYRGYCAQITRPYREQQINNNNKRIIQYKGWLTNIMIQRRNITRD